MAFDAGKLAAMRGDPDTSVADPDEPDGDEDEGAEPGEEELAAAKRLCAAVESKNYRAIVAAVKDLG
jgi:hypothetical protein